MSFFTLQHTDQHSRARAGEVQTDHGAVPTPMFMPVGTLGAVKGVQMQDVDESIGSPIMLSNTYHLYLRPGIDVLQAAGGLHAFNGWAKPILTDSGGYQVYSLAHNRKIKEDGVVFKSHIDGSKHFFTPEKVVDIQRAIGADIMMSFDECAPYPCEKSYARKAMHVTHRWTKQCQDHFNKTKPLYDYQQFFMPIVQGSVYPDLRKESAEYIASLGAVGNAIGGLSVGEPHEDMYSTTDLVCSILPADRLRYLMGVGTPANILECIGLGVDFFDCVMPTRNARNGMLFTRQGIMNIRNRKWKDDFSPIDINSVAPSSQKQSKAFLRHLFISGEMLGPQLASINNLALYRWLVTEAREQILKNNFSSWKEQQLKQLMTRL